MENKRFLIVIAVFVGIILLVPIMALFQTNNLTELERAINGNRTQLVYVGSSTCPWCEQFEPVLQNLAQEAGFQYLEFDLAELTSAENTRLRELLGKSNSSFGVPYTVLVGNGQILAELPGFNEEAALYNFLVTNDFIEGVLQEENLESGEVDGEVNEDLMTQLNEMFNADEKSLIILGESTCPWCQQFIPVVKEVAEETTLNYIYVELDKETRATYFEVADVLGVANFGVPYSLVVANGEIVSDLSGYRDKEDLLEYLKTENVIE